MIKHIFFDLDRTLWDFEKNSQHALKLLFSKYQLNKYVNQFYDFFYTYKRINADLWVKYGKGKISKEELRAVRFEKTLEKFNCFDKELAEQLSNDYIETSPNLKKLFPHTHNVLENLKSEGYNLHIITNGFREVQIKKLTNCELIHYFDIIVSSEDIGFNKPDSRIFNHALNLAEAKAAESLMVGDDLNVDVNGAANVGMHAFLFDPEKRYRKVRGFQVVNDLLEIPSLVPFIL